VFPRTEPYRPRSCHRSGLPNPEQAYLIGNVKDIDDFLGLPDHQEGGMAL
jgi:hypothetical protein